MDVGDPRLLAVRVLGSGVERAAGDDPGLQRRVPLDEGRVGEQRIAERQVPVQLLAVGQDVEVDAERGPGTDHRADEHRPARRPRIRSGLWSEPELAEQCRHDRHVVRRRGDRQVDDALAGQPGHRRAADVLDGQVGTALADQLCDGRCHLDRPAGPTVRLSGAVGRRVRSAGSPGECRLRAHETGHRPAHPRGGRRLSHQPDRPGRPGGRGYRHG